MYDSFANAYVSLANKEDFSYKLETRNTAGSAANVRLLSGKYIELGIAQADLVEEPIMEPGNSGTKHTRDIKRLQRFIRRHVRSSCARIQRLRHWMIFLGKRSVSGQRNPGQSGTQTRFCRHRASAEIGKDCQFGLHGGGSETCRWRDRCVLLYSGNDRLQ